MLNKIYITAEQLLSDSYQMGLEILDSEFKPDFIVGIWRGGTPIGIAVHELLRYFGVASDHIAIRTAHYTGLDETAETVIVDGLDYLVERVNKDSHVLIVDDVFDSGRSVRQVLADLKDRCGEDNPICRIAAPYFKPGRNKTDMIPDYFIHQTDDWLVFPHELEGLTPEELLANKPGIDVIRARLESLES